MLRPYGKPRCASSSHRGPWRPFPLLSSRKAGAVTAVGIGWLVFVLSRLRRRSPGGRCSSNGRGVGSGPLRGQRAEEGNEQSLSCRPPRGGRVSRDSADEPAPAEKRMPPNTCTVIHDRGSEEMHFNRENVEKLLAGDTFFWLDLDQPNEDDYKILRDVFKFHPLAVEDSEKFGQRAKIDDYDDYIFLVVYGAVPDDDRLVEVHCFYSEQVPRHRPPRRCPAFTEVRQRYVKRDEADRRPGAAPLPDPRRARRQLLPDPGRLRRPHRRARGPDLPATPSDEQLQEIFQMKRLLVGMRKAVTPQRDMFASLMGGVAELPGMTPRTNATSATSTTT